MPRSLWPEVRDRTTAMMREMKMGDPQDFRTFVGAVIDKRAFTKISEYLDDARKNAKILQGGTAKGDTGYFIEPTLVETSDPGYRLMCEEIFGPVVTACVYDDAEWTKALETLDRTSPYALTGSVFARDRAAIQDAMTTLRDAAGNFYINDKPTGAVVAGTNDKAGSKLNLVRWVSARTVKETFAPPRDYGYPYMVEE
jgi:1-pyrroline-5-carboxylate dehydrogenase